MNDEWIWTFAFALMLTALVGVCIPAIEYVFGGWAWLILLLLACGCVAVALAITGAHKEGEE